MQGGNLLTGRGTWQNGSDVAIPEIHNKAIVTSLMTSAVSFYKCILNIYFLILQPSSNTCTYFIIL